MKVICQLALHVFTAQTASGKTHTVEGCLSPAQVRALASGSFPNIFAATSLDPRCPGTGMIERGPDVLDISSRAGLIHRLMHGLFSAIDEAGADTSFKLSCQLVEIYNEGLRDLLQKGITAETRRSTRQGLARNESTASIADASTASVADASTASVADASAELDAASAGSGIVEMAANDGPYNDDGSDEAATADGSSGGDERLRLLRSAVSSGKTTGLDTPLGTDGNILQIREDPDRGVFVAGAAQLPVSSARHVYEALALGAAYRSTAATGMNERSSRSHSVFQLYITQRRLDSMTTVRSTLTIVDLAGSERVRS